MQVPARNHRLMPTFTIFLAICAPFLLGAQVIAGTSACVTPPSGLVSWWQAEGNALDSIDGNDGILAGNTVFGAGRAGQAFVFDGTAASITVPASASLNVQSFTIESWVNPTNVSNRMPVADFAAATGLSGVHLWISEPFGGGGVGSLFANVRSTSSGLDQNIITSSAGLVTSNQWSHVALTFDMSSGDVRLYVNGTNVAARNLGSIVPQTALPLNIGVRPATGSEFFAGTRFAGKIDELSLYNRALTTGEIQSIYSAGSAGKCPPPPPTPPCAPAPSGLVSWWPGQGSANDIIGANHGALQNGVSFVPGNVNTAFSFEGGSSVKVGANPSLTMSNSFSVEVWIYPTGPGGNPIYGGIIINKEGQYELARFADGTIQWAVAAANNPIWLWVNSGYVAPVGQWTHLAWTYDFGVSKIFANGQLVQSYAGSSGPVGSLTEYFPNEFWIGNRQDVSASQWFQGLLDDVSLYSRALTVAEIEAIYTAGSAGKCSPAPPPICVEPPSGLVSWWQAEGNPNDSADGNHGTLQNGATIVAGKVGQAFSFDGVDDVVTVPDAPNLRFGPISPMTVDMWVFRTSSNPGQHMIGKRAGCTGSSTEGTFQLFLDMNTGAGLGFGGPSGACACSGQDLPLNTWTHLTGTFDGTTLRLFINGQLAGTTPGSLGPANTAPLKIGDSGSCGALYGQAFGGLIDEVSIYNRALSTNEIQAIYNAGSTGKCPPPPPTTCVTPPSGVVSWWRAEGSALDSADGNQGTLVGNAAYAAGKVGQAFSFDGNGDAIFIGNPANLRLQTLTIEGWVKRSSATQISSNPLFGEIVGYGPGGYVLGFRQDGSLFLSKNTVSDVRSVGTISDTAWHHVAVTKNGSTVVFYLDGAAEPAITYNTTFEFATDLRIGAVNSGVEASFLGMIDDLSIYSRALALTEIQSIYNAGSAGKCPPPTPTTCVAAPTGLVSWWRAESNTLDSADGNQGTLVGNAAYAAGKVGQAFSFDGNGDAIFIGNPANLRLQTLTIEGWVKRSSATQISSHALFGEIVGYGPGGYVLGFRQDGSLFLSKNTVSDVRSVGTITDTAWHHVAVTKNGSAVVFYLDGVAEPAITYNTTFEFGTDLRIGAVNSGAEASFLGMIDELSIYDRALGLAEVRSIYNAASAGKCGLPPTILTHPQNRTVAVGENATFGVSATGSPQLRYQWHFGAANIPIPGATNSSLTVSNAQFEDAGDYRVVVSNDFGSAPSSAAHLTVNAEPVCVTSPSGLVHWWQGAGNANDGAGGANGTLQNGATFSAGKVGQAFTFDGADDHVSFGNTAGNFGTNDFTVEFWMQTTSTDFVNSVLEKWPVCGFANRFNIRMSGPGVGTGYLSMELESDSAGNNYVGLISGKRVNDGVYHHVALVRSPTTLSCFIDGALDVAAPTPGIANINNAANLVAGKSVCVGADGTTYFRGQLDEISLYHRALSASEIQSIYDAGSAGKCAPPLVNHAPTAQAQSVSVREDIAASITLTGADVDGDTLTFSVVDAPTHGTLAGTVPNLTYTPSANYFGPDSFTFKVNDGQVDSALATVSINVHSTNDAPVAKATVSPLAQFPGLTNLVVIAFNNTNAEVLLDGSLSSDAENDPLQYSWSEGTNVIAAGVLATNVLDVGTHVITLTVSDGTDVGMATVEVEVITPAQSIGILISMVDESSLPRKSQRPLNATLKVSAASFDDGNVQAGIHQLEAFQNKVRAQIAPLDQALADSLSDAAQEIIDAMSGP